MFFIVNGDKNLPPKSRFIYSCNACDTLFSTLMSLEHHKELYDHWSEDEYISDTDFDEDEEEEDENDFELDDSYLKRLRRRAREEETEFRQNGEATMLLL